MSLRAVLLDAAGTLIELREPVGETYGRFAARLDVPIPAWRLDDAFARVMKRADPLQLPAADSDVNAVALADLERSWWRSIVRSTFLAADSTVSFRDPDGLFDSLFTWYSGADAWRPTAGARTALKALRGLGLRTGVASNFDHRLHGILEALDLEELFDSVTIPFTCRARKPDPAFFAAAVAAVGAEPERTLFVGDDPEVDSAAARRAGLQALDLSELPNGLADLPARVDAPATLGRRSPRDRSPSA